MNIITISEVWLNRQRARLIKTPKRQQFKSHTGKCLKSLKYCLKICWRLRLNNLIKLGFFWVSSRIKKLLWWWIFLICVNFFWEVKIPRILCPRILSACKKFLENSSGGKKSVMNSWVTEVVKGTPIPCWNFFWQGINWAYFFDW